MDQVQPTLRSFPVGFQDPGSSIKPRAPQHGTAGLPTSLLGLHHRQRPRIFRCHGCFFIHPRSAILRIDRGGGNIYEGNPAAPGPLGGPHRPLLMHGEEVILRPRPGRSHRPHHSFTRRSLSLPEFRRGRIRRQSLGKFRLQGCRGLFGSDHREDLPSPAVGFFCHHPAQKTRPNYGQTRGG